MIKSTIKSTYKTVRATGKYVKSCVVTPTLDKNILSWTSFIILFKHPKGTLVLDTAYIFIGDIPDNIHAYYINFMNWSVNNNQLIYKPSKDVKKIIVNPENIHLHIHVGDTPFDSSYFTDNPIYFLHFFSSPQNKTYKAIKEQLISSKIKIYNINNRISQLNLRDRSEKILDPRFSTHKHQIYGEHLDHVVFTGLNIDIL